MIHLSIVSWYSASIKCSRSVCYLSYHSGARGLYKHWLYSLVFMFRFLWISAGPTYSALRMNANKVSGDIRFRRKLLFHCCSIDSEFPLFMYLQSFFFRFWNLLPEHIYSLLCLFDLGTRWSSLHGMGVATSWWAYIHSFIKQTSRLNNSFGIENCHVVVWLLLKIYLFGCVGWWERLYTIFIFTLLYLYFSATDFRIYKGASIKIY